MGYYMGDPGFFSFLQKGAALLAPSVPVVGGTLSKIISKLPAPVRSAGMRAGSAIIKHPAISAAGGAAVVGLAGAEAGKMGILGRGGRGYKPSKRHLHALAMGLRRARPRMNPCNVHALRRAARRAHSFLRISRRLVGHFTAKKPKGRAYIKSKKRSK